MEIRHLKCMLAVANEGHFNLAAKRLHMAQPALSRSIRQLEEDVGAKLFARTTRKVVLTDAGRMFYQEAIKALNQLENAARSARSASRGEAGSITVGFTSTAIFGPLSQTMREFSRRYPDMQVITRECSIQTLFDSLNEGTIDVACNEECVPNASFDMKEYPAVDVVIALPKAHRFAQEEGPIKLKLLCEETFVLPTQNATWSVYDKFVRALAKAGFHPKHEYWVDSAISGIALVAAGFGICLVPQFAEILHSEVTYRRVTDPDIKITPQLVWKKNRASLPIANLVALVPVPHERTSKKPRKRTPEHTGS